MNLDENKVVGASALIKLGQLVNLTMSLTVVLFPTADPVSARAKVSAAINQYLATFTFGKNLEMSDLLLVAQLGTFSDQVISEVDYVVFDQNNISGYVPDSGQTINMVNDVLTVSGNQYIRPYSITIL
jgi:hypothetical protein